MRQMKYKVLLHILAAACLLASCERAFEYDTADVPAFKGLEAPAEGTGYQVHIPPFPVPANFEREFVVRMEVGNTEDIYVNGFTSLCRPGTHHLIAYGYENESYSKHPPVGVMRDQNLADGRGNLTLTTGTGAMYYLTQVPDFKLNLPEGTAMKMHAGATVDINSHYFNLTNEQQYGEVFLNFNTVKESEVQETLIIDEVDNDENLFLPKGETTDIEYTKLMYERTEIRMMISHMHKRGVQFDVYLVGGDRDGELVYESYDYQHAPTKFFEPALVLEEGEGLRTKVRYYNNSNRDIVFGVTSEDEMGILFFLKKEN